MTEKLPAGHKYKSNVAAKDYLLSCFASSFINDGHRDAARAHLNTFRNSVRRSMRAHEVRWASLQIKSISIFVVASLEGLREYRSLNATSFSVR